MFQTFWSYLNEVFFNSFLNNAFFFFFFLNHLQSILNLAWSMGLKIKTI